MQPEIKTPESAAMTRFVQPAEEGLDHMGSAIVRNGAGEIIRVDIRSDAQYERAGVALARGRKARAAFEAFWKQDPGKPQSECGPGEGMGYFARRMWESANSIYNHFDLRLRSAFGTSKEGGLIDRGMAEYRAEVDRKAREEAEAKAAAERKRLEAEAQKQREAAEAERKRAEAEAEKRRKAELAAATSKREKEAAERRAADAKRQAEEDAAIARQNAELKAREAENVQAVIESTAPVSSGTTVRRVWKARLENKDALIKAVAVGQAPARLLVLDERAANDLAGAFGGENPPAGLAFYSEEITSARGRR